MSRWNHHHIVWCGRWIMVVALILSMAYPLAKKLGWMS